jgi:hypothetical protein
VKIAWFRASARPHPFDDTPSLDAELGRRHQLEIYDARRAHDFVWHQFREPAVVGVYEIRDRADDAYIWPYLLHYPGILRLRSFDLRDSRRETLRLSRRFADDAAETAFAGPHRLRIPLLASRLVAVGDRTAALALQETHPQARIRYVAPGVDVAAAAIAPLPDAAWLRVGVPSPNPVVERAAKRAQESGFAIAVVPIESRQALQACDAVAVLEWPPAPEPPVAALVAMASGLPVIVFEGTATAAWPALDPQAWRPRGFGDVRQPIAISIDPRDAEHSLLLALRRLAGDTALRATLGAAAREWVSAHATATQAAAAWDDVLAEAATLPPPVLPRDWPAHLCADGTARARAILDEMGVEFPL